MQQGKRLRGGGQVKRLLSILALASLAACGGGGSSDASGADPVRYSPAPLVAPKMVAPTCERTGAWIACDLVSSEQLIGVEVPTDAFASFTNNSGTYLQINNVSAYTGEHAYWSEFCVYIGDVSNLTTSQSSAGKGEVGCSTKQIGEDYAPIRWGEGLGLSVAPGETVFINSHTEPGRVHHTYALSVQVQATGVHAWRQPQVDEVIFCNDQMQTTAMSPWQNNTGRELYFNGASIYAETASSATPNTLSGAACIYVLTEDGTQKYTNCDSALRTRGEVSFPTVSIAPGDYIAARAGNLCRAPAYWNWVAFLRVWG